MRYVRFNHVVPAVLAGLCVVLVAVWLNTGTVDGLYARVPGLDREGVSGSVEALPPPEMGDPIVAEGPPAVAAPDLPGTWPWFRGPERDAICRDGVPLAREWPESGPEVLWRVDLGPGHAGAAAANGRVYVLDYDVPNQADTMRCLGLHDGKEIWRNSYPVVVPDSHGMSRTVPAVVDGHVVSIGPRCHVACWDAETGEGLWILDMVGRYGATVPQWYTGQCPLVDDGRVILAPSGSAFLVAVDLRTGDVVWESPKLRDWAMTHVSILPMEFAGRRMYVYCGSRGVAGISADDGSVLWETTEWIGNTATCPTPLPIGDGRIFFTSGYRAGSVMLRLEERGGKIVARTLFRLTPRQFGSEQQTPILYENHIYGVRTGAGGMQLACLDLDGNEVWNSGRDKFARGPYLIADGLIYVMDSVGLLTLAEATPGAYNPLGKFQVFEEAHDAWGPMAMVGGRLILRDVTRMACLDVAEK